MIPFIGPIISGLFGLGKTYMEERKEVKQATHERKIQQIKSVDNWENLQIQGGLASWKDEFLTIVAVTPMILVFIPSMREYAVDGFTVLSNPDLIPEWYLYLISAVFAAGLGVKGLVGAIKKLK